MKTSKKVYAALKREYPGMSNTQIGRIVGMAHSSISKLNRGIGIGLQAAQHLSKLHPRYTDLYCEVRELAENIRKDAIEKREATKRETAPTEFNPAILPRHLQRFCGYLELAA